MHHIYRNPARTIAEGLEAGNSDIRPVVVQLGNLGIKLAILGYKKDNLCPINNTLKDCTDLIKEHGILTHVLNNPNAGHLAPQVYPQEVARVHLSLIKAMNKSGKRPTSVGHLPKAA
jgi:hypothetical protein